MTALSAREHVDFLVLGGGVAGLSFALEAAGHGSVLVLTKRQRSEGSTQYAQGGVASVLGPDDNFELHIEDTLVAGAGLNHRDAVEVTVREGPERIRWLLSLGVELDREAHDRLHLTREGGHSRRRVAHAKDTTGREIERALLRACEAKGVRIVEDQIAIDLLTSGKAGLGGTNRVLGAYVLDRASGKISVATAGATILATGGAGKVYLYTSNPDVATGDGVAMAYRAGATIANMEFFQFHPTCLFHPQAKSFLISEALRGEGGILRNGAGEPFMSRYDARKELAPRDVVARSIDAEMKRRGDDCAFLDMSHLPKGFLLEHFPHIYATCKEFGIDMAVQPIPVVPAAHYQCGGVVTDLMGRTTVQRLYAIGEVSCTGLHGANRLASNSLLEGLVFARRIADDVTSTVDRSAALPGPVSGPPGDGGWVIDPAVRESVQAAMTRGAGVLRSDESLSRTAGELAELGASRSAPEVRAWEATNLLTVATALVAAAVRRKETRGCHWREDFPEVRDEWRGHLLPAIAAGGALTETWEPL